MTVVTLENAQPRGRVARRPKHKFQLEQQPYQIVPFCIAPVLPAETMKSWYMEVREVSDPIANRLIGWTSEWYLFYVKIRDLNDRVALEELFTNPTGAVTALNTAANVYTYHAGGSPDYTAMCERRVVETFFRDEDEVYGAAASTLGPYPMAQLRDQGWMDSLMDTTVLSAGAGDPGAVTNPESMDKLMDAYEYLRAMQLTNMSFEDYLRTFGIKLAKAELHKPELIAKKSDFQYPSNTIDPATGAASSAVSWVIKASEREAKLFKEPGFIFGVHVIRPKVYMGRQYGSLAHYLDQGLSWLPAIMREAPETSLREFTGGAAGNGPLSNGTTGPTNGYWVDMRDLFLYGDQLVNFALTATDNHLFAVPGTDLRRKYATQADITAAFAGATSLVRCDGFVSFSIDGTQIDYTGGNRAA